MLKILSIFKWFFASKDRAIATLSILALLGIWIYILTLKGTIADLKQTVTEQSSTIATLNADVIAAKATIAGLRATENMSKTESSSINDLLNQCYSRLAQYEADFAEIDDQMEAGKTDTSIHEGGNVYDSVTRSQQESGASYINRQFDSLK